jgi:hypothetical protein
VMGDGDGCVSGRIQRDVQVCLKIRAVIKGERALRRRIICRILVHTVPYHTTTTTLLQHWHYPLSVITYVLLYLFYI